MVHFEKIGLALVVQHDVEAQDMEACGVFEIIQLNALVNLVKAWLSGN